MLANLWTLIKLILEAIGLWKFVLSERDKEQVAEGQKTTQERDKAVDEQQVSQTEDDFDKAQDSIVAHKPH